MLSTLLLPATACRTRRKARSCSDRLLTPSGEKSRPTSPTYLVSERQLSRSVHSDSGSAAAYSGCTPREKRRWRSPAKRRRRRAKADGDVVTAIASIAVVSSDRMTASGFSYWSMWQWVSRRATFAIVLLTARRCGAHQHLTLR